MLPFLNFRGFRFFSDLLRFSSATLISDVRSSPFGSIQFSVLSSTFATDPGEGLVLPLEVESSRVESSRSLCVQSSFFSFGDISSTLSTLLVFTALARYPA